MISEGFRKVIESKRKGKPFGHEHRTKLWAAHDAGRNMWAGRYIVSYILVSEGAWGATTGAGVKKGFSA